MTPSTALARLRLAARLCRLGAGLILVAGLVVDIYLSFFVIFNPGDQQQAAIDPRQLLISLVIAVLIAIPIFFFFIFLYAIGAFLDYTSAREKTEEPIEERIEITPLRR